MADKKSGFQGSVLGDQFVEDLLTGGREKAKLRCENDLDDEDDTDD